MRMYSLYNNNKDFLGKYVRKEQAVNDILDIFVLEGKVTGVKIYKSLDENEWIFVKDKKVLSKYQIRVEEV